MAKVAKASTQTTRQGRKKAVRGPQTQVADTQNAEVSKTVRRERSRAKASLPEQGTEDIQNVETAELVPYDETLLDRARTQWQFGDWESLIKLNADDIQHHPQRGKLALLASAGYFQAGNLNEAHRYIRLAQDWGINPKLIAQMLISGAHNTLGRLRALLDQSARAKEHYRYAVSLGGVPGDVELLSHARSAWQSKKCNENLNRK
jgi:hypothetical protein